MAHRNAEVASSGAWRPRRRLAGAAFSLALAPLPAAALPLPGDPAGGRPLLVAGQEAPATTGQSAEDLKAAIADIKRRLAEQRQATEGERPAVDLAGELKAARLQVERLTQAMAELRSERDAIRSQLASARGEQQALQSQLALARKELEQKGEGLRQAEAEAARLRQQLAEASSRAGEAARLDQALAAAQAESERLARAKQDAEALLEEREAALTAELDAAKAELATLAKEASELRAVATASVNEVRSLGEQLIAALGDNKALTAAVGELRASKDLLDKELQATKGAAPAGSAPTPTLAKLEAPEASAPAAGPAQAAPAMTRLDGSAFVTGGAELRPEAAPMLQAVADFLRAREARAVRIVGHTDSNGDREANRALSMRRAEKVRDYLVASLGLDPAQVAVEGAGEDQPIAPNDTAVGRRANRRVEVYVAP